MRVDLQRHLMRQLLVSSYFVKGADGANATASEEARELIQQLGSQRFFAERMLDALPDSVVATDLAGKVIYWNAGAEKLYGYRAEEALGREVTFIVAPEQTAAERNRMQQVLDRGHWSGSYVQRRKDGSTFVADTRIALVSDHRGRPLAFVGVDRERKAAQAPEQSDTVARSAFMLFVAGLAHELRNPLQALAALIDSFAERFGEVPGARPFCQHLQSSTRQLERLVEDLLTYARPLQAADEPASTADAVQEAVGGLQDLAAECGVEIELQLAADCGKVATEVRTLCMALRNMLRNALQHSDTGSCVTVLLDRQQRESRCWVRCRVHDTGRGFSARDLERATQPFYSRTQGGTGLGLAIVQRIAEQLGGSLRLYNRPSGGAGVELLLPAAE